MNRPSPSHRSRNIILVGMPCSGKTTFGRVYAARTRRQFVDFDDFVEKHASRTIPEIFAAEGEAGFRIREQKCLRRLEKKRGAVIAMGGGTLCNAVNLKFAMSLGLVVCLSTPLDEVARRALRDGARRPLFAPCSGESEALEVARRLWDVRHEYYECADILLETQFSSLDNLTLQLMSIERRASGIIQRRVLPPLLVAAAALPVDQELPLPPGDGLTMVAPVLQSSEQVVVPEGEVVVESAETSTPVAVSPRSPAETWDDVQWRTSQEVKGEVRPDAGKRGRSEGRPEGRREDGKGRKRQHGRAGDGPREGEKPASTEGENQQRRDGRPPQGRGDGRGRRDAGAGGRRDDRFPRRDPAPRREEGRTAEGPSPRREEPRSAEGPGQRRDGQRSAEGQGPRRDGRPPRRDDPRGPRPDGPRRGSEGPRGSENPRGPRQGRPDGRPPRGPRKPEGEGSS